MVARLVTVYLTVPLAFDLQAVKMRALTTMKFPKAAHLKDGRRGNQRFSAKIVN